MDQAAVHVYVGASAKEGNDQFSYEQKTKKLKQLVVVYPHNGINWPTVTH